MKIVGELKEVDVDLALRTMGGFEHIYEKVIETFLYEQRTLVDDLSRSLKEDYQEARRLVHSCKGISQNLGSKRLFEVSSDFEEAILNRDMGLINDYFISFKDLFNIVVDDLQKIEFDKK